MKMLINTGTYIEDCDSNYCSLWYCAHVVSTVSSNILNGFANYSFCFWDL